MARADIHATRHAFAHNVRRTRLAKKLTRKELATAAGLIALQVVEIESATYNVGVDVMNRLAAALGASPFALMTKRTPSKTRKSTI
jgi:transcriptional regulator with XRE-family HTH domain